MDKLESTYAAISF